MSAPKTTIDMPFSPQEFLAMRAADATKPQLPEPDCWAVLTPNGSKLVSPEEVRGLLKAYPLFTGDQMRAARIDARRLDWLEAEANEPGGLLLHDGNETGRRGLGLRPGMFYRTLREAIDTAMGTEPTDKRDGA